MGERKTEEKGQTAKKGRKRLGFHQTVLRNWNYQKAGASSLNPPRPRKETKALEFELFGSIGICCTAATSGASLWTEYWVDADVRRVEKGSD